MAFQVELQYRVYVEDLSRGWALYLMIYFWTQFVVVVLGIRLLWYLFFISQNNMWIGTCGSKISDKENN